jgi:type I restriction enzyme S subunit
MEDSRVRSGLVRDVARINAHSIKGEHAPSEIKYIDISSVGTGEFTEWPKSISFADAPSRARRIVKSGDTILSTVRPNRRSFLFLASPGPNTVASTGFAVLTPTKDVDARYLYYWVTRQEFTDYLSLHAKGAAYPAVSPDDIGAGQIDLPPLPVQRRISGVLSAYDELIENSQRRIKILESMARVLFREWFVHFRFPGHENCPRVASPLGEIPQAWNVTKLGDVASYVNRGIAPTYDEDGESVVINQKCIRDQRLSLTPARRQSKSIPAEKQVQFGDVLINSTGVGTLGRVAQVYEALENCTVDTHVTIVRPGGDNDLDFFGCSLLYRQELFERLGVGATGQTELGRAAIAQLEIVVPPSAIQRKFGEVARGIRSASVACGKQIENLRLTRDLLLPRLLSGQFEANRQPKT